MNSWNASNIERAPFSLTMTQSKTMRCPAFNRVFAQAYALLTMSFESMEDQSFSPLARSMIDGGRQYRTESKEKCSQRSGSSASCSALARADFPYPRDGDDDQLPFISTSAIVVRRQVPGRTPCRPAREPAELRDARAEVG